jgi:hypothetical protein
MTETKPTYSQCRQRMLDQLDAIEQYARYLRHGAGDPHWLEDHAAELSAHVEGFRASIPYVWKDCRPDPSPPPRRSWFTSVRILWRLIRRIRTRS